MGQGANIAAYSAAVVAAEIAAETVYDEVFCRRVARAEVPLGASAWTNLVLDPPPWRLRPPAPAVARAGHPAANAGVPRRKLTGRAEDNVVHPATKILSTRAAPGGESLDYWRHVHSDAFVPLEAAAPEPSFRGEVRIDRLGSTPVSRVDAGPHRVRRTKAMINASERGYYELGLQVRGSCLLVQDGREALLGPGNLALYDTDRPYTLAFGEPTSMAVFMFPRERLRLDAGERGRSWGSPSAATTSRVRCCRRCSGGWCTGWVAPRRRDRWPTPCWTCWPRC
ncbi:cupin domain-containing protein [Amycolatopsis methanolica]|uniref:cupin domain-containing protein n=1 Tax=Amycolatopsis methanolica TaxID=1814 RepID=UPI003425F9BA